MEPSSLRAITHSCLNGLEFLHNNGITHSNLCSRNILLRSRGRTGVKLIGFEYSKSTNSSETSFSFLTNNRPPESILLEALSPQADMWSLGCIICEMIQGSELFVVNTEEHLLMTILSLLGPPEPALMDTYRSHGDNIRKYDEFFAASEVFATVPESTAEPIPLNSLSRHISLLFPTIDIFVIRFIAQCLQWNDQSRITSRDALHHRWIEAQYPVTREAT